MHSVMQGDGRGIFWGEGLKKKKLVSLFFILHIYYLKHCSHPCVIFFCIFRRASQFHPLPTDIFISCCPSSAFSTPVKTCIALFLIFSFILICSSPYEFILKFQRSYGLWFPPKKKAVLKRYSKYF